MEINEKVLQKTIEMCKRRGIIIPKFSQLKNPNETVPERVKTKLKHVGLWDINPLNLFRITWKNDIQTGLFGNVNYLEIPQKLSGVKARIVGLVGKFFPTGAHKVGAAFGCLIPKLITGNFDPTTQKAVWPSTGNFCRGGAFDCAILSCTAVAILPEGMSKERFQWLESIGAEIIKTPGSESNVKEIYDKCWEIKRTRPECVIFNQFEEFGNSIWHYEVTGSAVEEVYNQISEGKTELSAFVCATGSAGTIATGDYLKKKFPKMKVVVAEALQCPTLLMCGYGTHRIEGIGDKHVPWIHNVRNTDMVVAINDEDAIRILRLFNEPAGKKILVEYGLDENFVNKLELLGISSICNLLASIKVAKYYELKENNVVFTIFTDSAELYQSRLKELTEERGPYTEKDAIIDLEKTILGLKIDFMKELSYYDRKAIHNLKYFTWVEQQGKTVEELNRLWDEDFWEEIFSKAKYYDELIDEFNRKTGLLEG